MKNQIVDKKTWIEKRKAHLEKEKAFTLRRDELSAERGALPWLAVEEDYRFSSAQGESTLGDLFQGKRQLIIYHFMFDPEWEAGCKSCSFWADNFNGIDVHLQQRDIAFVVISRNALKVLENYQARMGWSFPWVSSLNSNFNYDFGVSFESSSAENYNFGTSSFKGEAPGISVLYKDDEGNIFRTYSTYSRGLDMLNGAYHFMDLTPKGRDESNLDYAMEWLRRNDEY